MEQMEMKKFVEVCDRASEFLEIFNTAKDNRNVLIKRIGFHNRLFNLLLEQVDDESSFQEVVK